MLIGHHAFQGWCKGRPLLKGWLESIPGTLLRVFLTLFCFSTSLVIFRAASLSGAGMMLSRLFGSSEGIGTPLPGIGLWLTLAIVFAAHVWMLSYAWTQRHWGWAWLERVPAPVVGLSYVALLSLTLVLAPEAGKAFIYFQF
jgi:alginate O-acetyltransferase complex protein AlgI